jgi:peroxiredoxin Q/BCP
MAGAAALLALGLLRSLTAADGPPAAAATGTAPPSAGAEAVKPLEAGDPAPPFRLAGSDGKTYGLDDFKGKKAVVLAWFPKASTGG